MSAPQAAAPSPFIQEVHLLGVPPLSKFVDHVARRSIDAETVERSALIDQWRRAAQHYQALATRESGIADQATMLPIPSSRGDWVERTVAHADFRKTFSDLPVAFALVELDRLVVYQQHVSLTHAERFGAALAGADSRDDAIFDICMPDDAIAPAVKMSRCGGGKFVFQSELSDLRAYGARLLDAETAATLATSNGPASAGVVIPVGYGMRHLNVVRVGTRMVLNNGYHRAHALRSAGITHVPCVIQAVAHPEELAFAGGSSLIDNFDALFDSARPPLFKDFFDPQLSTRLKLQRARKQVQITVTIETLRVPD